MNTYYKFAPNVFLAKCEEKHERGEEILVTTKYGKENACIVFNLIAEKSGFYYYSIVRADGFNVQEWARQRAERRHEWALSAAQKSGEYFQKSNKHRDFLSLSVFLVKRIFSFHSASYTGTQAFRFSVFIFLHYNIYDTFSKGGKTIFPGVPEPDK